MADILAKLREQRNSLSREANQLNDQYPDRDTPMPKDQLDKLNGIMDKIEGVDDEIKTQERLDKLAGEEFINNASTDDIRDQFRANPSNQSDESNALRIYLRDGGGALDAGQMQAMMARRGADYQNAMSTTTNSEGGYTCSPEYIQQLEEAMKDYGGMREATTVFQTSTGNVLNFPTTDATSEKGEIVGQNQQVSAADTTFGNATIEVYKYSSKSIALPMELLQDSFLDIEAYIRTLLAVRIGRITNEHNTIGTGSGQPFGIVTQAKSGKVGKTGQTLTVTYDDFVDLEHSINRAYRRSAQCGYMFSDNTLAVVRKLKDDNQRPIFVPGYETGNPGGAPDRLLNRAIYINDDMPDMAADAKSILFGDLGKYMIRDVMDLTLFRMTDSAFTLKGQVGFVGFMRSGGNLIDAGGAVKYYQNSAT